MPSSDAILQGLTAIANEFRWLAFAWHVMLAGLVGATAAGWRPTRQFLGVLIALPFVGVSVLAWRSGNPFNGTMMAATALALSLIGTRGAPRSIGVSSTVLSAAGVLMILFGAFYPHFLAASGWYEYLHSAPFGLIPCPTLSVAIGLTLLFGLFESRAWTTALTLTGLFYGLFGAVQLGVVLDVGLIAGAMALAFAAARPGTPFRSVRARRMERRRMLPGDELIADPLASLTHAVTIDRPPRDVWPWLVQMGAGRAGWYSYDFIDNGGRASAARIVDRLQHIRVGTVFPALPGARDAFTVLATRRERFLIIGWAPPNGSPLMTWAFVLEPRGDSATRLLVRVRGTRAYRFHGLPPQLSKAIVWIVHPVMERRQLLGIAARAESHAATPSRVSVPEQERKPA